MDSSRAITNGIQGTSSKLHRDGTKRSIPEGRRVESVSVKQGPRNSVIDLNIRGGGWDTDKPSKNTQDLSSAAVAAKAYGGDQLKSNQGGGDRYSYVGEVRKVRAQARQDDGGQPEERDRMKLFRDGSDLGRIISEVKEIWKKDLDKEVRVSFEIDAKHEIYDKYSEMYNDFKNEELKIMKEKQKVTEDTIGLDSRIHQQLKEEFLLELYKKNIKQILCNDFDKIPTDIDPKMKNKKDALVEDFQKEIEEHEGEIKRLDVEVTYTMMKIISNKLKYQIQASDIHNSGNTKEAKKEITTPEQQSNWIKIENQCFPEGESQNKLLTLISELKSQLEKLSFGKNDNERIQMLSKWENDLAKEYQKKFLENDSVRENSQEIFKQLGLLSIVEKSPKDCIVSSITIRETDSFIEREKKLYPTFDVQLAFKRVTEDDTDEISPS